jgi:flagellar hook-basal body complex protein FliE
MVGAMNAVAAVGAATNATGAENVFSLAAPQQAAATPFSGLLTDAVGQTNQLESQARTAIDGLMTGTGVDVSDAMIAEQKADMAFELALSVRNKAVQAYQQVIGMQF